MTTAPIQPTTRRDFAALPRQELTFAACDALAARSRKPSVSLVRETTLEIAGVKKGSDGDVQEDIRLWYEALFALKRAAGADGVPDRMTAMFHTLWRAAVEQADERLVAEREKLARDREVLQDDLKRADQRSDALRYELDTAQAALEARDETIARLDQLVSGIRAEEQSLHAVILAKDERIEALTAELARKAADQAAALVELDGARKYALVQIDQARGEARHWKEQWDRSDQDARGARAAADTYRSKASNLESSLAGAMGRMGQLQETLNDEKARAAGLSGRLDEEQAFARKVQVELADLRVEVEALRTRHDAAKREVRAAKDLAAAATQRETEVVAELDLLRASSARPGLPSEP
ncbi:DNA-binding protein [Massilia sp. PAMC28688]|uniref:DNA-binding protein n=1 Tax=Massilia sp. PAMC28688 TaxID=2861283 RepID=UPI001C62BA74|nr:DNA-binding protein [Massilia sp. PAMC28688]QYF93026.1 DNA-binding protein [Massilia sp. PAMC28688]